MVIVYKYMRKTFKERVEVVRAQVIREMQQMRDLGMTMEEIGEEFGIKRAAVNNMLKGNSRKR